MKLKSPVAALSLVLLASTTALASPRQAADMVFVHGNVIPMTGPEAKAAAVAVKDGKILAIGSDTEIEKLKSKSTQVVDLAGRTMLPGFIDAHGHIAMVAQQADLAALAPPPVGGVTSIASLEDALRKYMATHPEGWIVGMGYDDAELAEKRHPTRHELDAVSTDRPILIMHISGHLAAANTKALEMAGLLHPDKDPPAGVIRREADGKIASGVIEEGALFQLYALIPQPTLERQLELLAKAQQVYASYGLTTAQDGATMQAGWNLLKVAAERKALFLDVHALPLLNQQWDGFDAIPFNAPYANHLRAAGVKIIADGSPQGRTAWLSHPYHLPLEGKSADYAGYPQLTDEALRTMLARADEHDWQAYIHVNGDAAIQQLIDAVRAVGVQTGKPMRRTIAIHSQTATLEELKEMKALDIEPTFFASHTYYWGDWHREVTLGPTRADHISPQRDAFDVGLRPSIHNDAPIVPPDMIRLIWSAVTRRTRSDDILGPEQRVTPYEALMEVTRNAAYELREEGAKGTLEPGKVADFVILDGDPLGIQPESLLTLKVVATIKDGRYIFGHP
ncbi:amidohydrolase [Novosphingobium pentaromativorans]|nr:amidohydrolase [Novosphingobium pentaromativorans]